MGGMNETHDCRDGCTGLATQHDRWNERTAHWYCLNGNDNCAAHTTPTDPSARPDATWGNK